MYVLQTEALALINMTGMAVCYFFFPKECVATEVWV